MKISDGPFSVRDDTIYAKDGKRLFAVLAVSHDHVDSFAIAALVTAALNENKVLTEALTKAKEHLEYCAYGDKWEREVADAAGLREMLSKALKEETV